MTENEYKLPETFLKVVKKDFERRHIMNLQQKLDALKKKFESSAPKEALEIMHRATEDLRNSAIMARIVAQGDQAPDFSLNNAFSRPVNLKERLALGPVVLGFYRGRW